MIKSPSQGPNILDRVRDSVVSARLTVRRSLLAGAGAGAVALLARLALQPIIDHRVPFITFFPALLAATLWGGRLGGVIALVVSVAGGLYFTGSGRTGMAMSSAEVVSLAVLLVSGALIVGMAMLLRDAILELAEARDRERLLARELQHRVKNSLMVVQSVAQQTARASEDLPGFIQAFTGRLVALGAANSLVMEEEQGGVELGVLVRRTLEPFVGADAARVRMNGPAVQVSAEQALTIALWLHELATNASKYGALSQPTGGVEVGWALAGGPHPKVEFDWKELGGPAVIRPAREGFGSRLLRRGAGAAAKLEFHPEGVRWTAQFPPSPVPQG